MVQSQIWNDFEWTKQQAELAYGETFGGTKGAFQSLPRALEPLRDALYEVQNEGHKTWALDWRVGLALHAFGGITPLIASNPRFWWRANIQLAPKLVAVRWGIQPNNLREPSKMARVFGRSRNYLGSVWWLARILTAGKLEVLPSDESELTRMLSRMSTDSIVAIVERTGRGYDHEVIHGICHRLFGDLSYSDKRDNQEVLRKVMKVNSAWLQNSIPELSEGGTAGYVQRLLLRAGV